MWHVGGWGMKMLRECFTFFCETSSSFFGSCWRRCATSNMQNVKNAETLSDTVKRIVRVSGRSADEFEPLESVWRTITSYDWRDRTSARSWRLYSVKWSRILNMGLKNRSTSVLYCFIWVCKWCFIHSYPHRITTWLHVSHLHWMEPEFTDATL